MASAMVCDWVMQRASPKGTDLILEMDELKVS